MTLFIVLAVGLVGLVLALLLPALLRRSPTESTGSDGSALAILRDQQAQLQAEHASGQISAAELAQAQQELARRVVEDHASAEGQSQAHKPPAASASRSTAWLVAGLLPLLAAGLYARLGEPEALNPAARAAAAAEAPLAPGASPSGTDVSMVQVEAMVAQMAERLEKMPASEATSDGWQMLARSLAALQRFPEADKAYQRAIELAPRNAGLLADRADLLILLQDPKQEAEATRLIARALQAEPDHPKALMLAGNAAMAQGNAAGALAYWQRARRQLPAGELAADLDRNIAAASQQLGAGSSVAKNPEKVAATSGQPAVSQTPGAKLPMGGSMMAGAASAGNTPASPPAKPATSAAALSGTVQLAPALQSQLKPGDTLFVYARAAQGPRLPLAVLRVPAGRFPANFTLDDSLAMSADWRLSAVPQVIIEARISRSGQAMPQTGDLVGRSAVVANRGGGLVVVIDQIQP